MAKMGISRFVALQSVYSHPADTHYSQSHSGDFAGQGATQSANYTKAVHAQGPQQSTFVPYPHAAHTPVSLDDNSDAIALRSAISILQIQRQTTQQDILTLQQLKTRALNDPATFVDALVRGEVRSRPATAFELPQPGVTKDDDDEVQDELNVREDTSAKAESQETAIHRMSQRWPEIPTSQNVVKMPTINWAQYGVVGGSLDKLHKDQLANPTEGVPLPIGSDGMVLTDVVSSANPASGSVNGPQRDTVQIEKMSTRKGGRR
jgi:hypothetical protein